MAEEKVFKYPTCIFWHIWSEWKTIETGHIARKDGSRIGNYLIQQRECAVCKKIELNRQSVSI